MKEACKCVGFPLDGLLFYCSFGKFCVLINCQPPASAWARPGRSNHSRRVRRHPPFGVRASVAVSPSSVSVGHRAARTWGPRVSRPRRVRGCVPARAERGRGRSPWVCGLAEPSAPGTPTAFAGSEGTQGLLTELCSAARRGPGGG